MASASPEPRQVVAELIVRELRDAGVHTLFGVPGAASYIESLLP